MSTVRVISPVTAVDLQGEAEVQRLSGRDRIVERSQVERGPASIESDYETALAVPDLLRLVVEAGHDGVDAAVVACMGDPGLRPAREVGSMLVVGAAETGMHVACLLGHRFSVLTVGESSIVDVENLARAYGVQERLASVRSVEISVLDLGEDPERLVRALTRESVCAVREDRAHVILFGCTAMTGLADQVRKALVDEGVADVPVIDPLPTAVRIAQALVDVGLSHSKRTYPSPPAKEISGFDYVTRPVREVLHGTQA